MTTFSAWTNKKNINKGSEYFSKLYAELDIKKYQLEKYKQLFMLGSFQVMHDADLAYDNIYRKCAQNATSKDNLLSCLAEEERLLTMHPECFDQYIYRQNIMKAIAGIRLQLAAGSLDYLYL